VGPQERFEPEGWRPEWGEELNVTGGGAALNNPSKKAAGKGLGQSESHSCANCRSRDAAPGTSHPQGTLTGVTKKRNPPLVLWAFTGRPTTIGHLSGGICFFVKLALTPKVNEMNYRGLMIAALTLVPQIATAGTVAHYRFENDNATVAVDETGINNGTIIGGAPFSSSVGQNPVTATGQPNTQSLSLSGTGQYASVPHNASLSFGNTPWTIEAFINVNALPTTATPGQYIAQKKAAAVDDFQDYGFLLGGNRSGLFGSFGKTVGVTGAELRVELGTGSSIIGITSNLEVASAGEWIFISAAYDGGTSLRFTLDDNLNDLLPGLVDEIALPNLVNTSNTGDLFIGAKRNNAGAAAQLFGGLIDEVRVSNEVLATSDLLSVPEPSTYVLAAFAAACLGMVIRRRRATA
jgi:hypothetical protein